jgi:hypothetical protein
MTDIGAPDALTQRGGRHVRWRPPDTDRKRLEVLYDRGEVELVTGAREASQSHALEAMMRLEMREPHLNLLALVARSVELRRAHHCPGEIAGILVDVSCNLAKEHPRKALRFERACIAVALGCKVAQHVPAFGSKTAAELSLDGVREFRTDAIAVGLTLKLPPRANAAE